jgi:hypothetical protein
LLAVGSLPSALFSQNNIAARTQIRTAAETAVYFKDATRHGKDAEPARTKAHQTQPVLILKGKAFSSYGGCNVQARHAAKNTGSAPER